MEEHHLGGKVICITGAAGYVGAMLVECFAKRSDISRVIAIDKEESSDLVNDLSDGIRGKVIYIQKTLGQDSWQAEVASHAPSIIIHTAWQIRELYRNHARTWLLNIKGSDEIFDYAFDPSHGVTKLIHFSTVASYGAFPENDIEHRFTEEEPFRKTDYLYAEEKRIAEEHLREKYSEAKLRGKPPEVIILRPAAITGPRGRVGRIRFGLQSALSGKLTGSPFYSIVRGLTQFVPVTKKWCRQFIHEDDVVGIVSAVVDSTRHIEYEVYNICPPGEVVRGDDMAQAVAKKALRVHPLLIRFVFSLAWHGSRGKITTSRGGWKSYSYPIAVDGSKISKDFGYTYLFSCKDAFEKHEGNYKAKYPLER